MAREITPEEVQQVADMVARGRAAMEEIKDYDQERVDRLVRALGWACGNEKTFVRIAQMGVHHYPRTAGQQTGANLKVILRAFKELFKLYGQIRREGRH